MNKNLTWRKVVLGGTQNNRRSIRLLNKDAKSFAHTTWNCKFHIVFVPKYRRRFFYYEKRREQALGLFSNLRSSKQRDSSTPQ